MAKTKVKQVKFLVTGTVEWADRNGKTTPRFIKEGDVLRLRVEDHFTGGYELWDDSASIIMDRDKIEIIG